MSEPRCYDCLSTDVTVKVVDDYGLEAWFCAIDWAAIEALRGKIWELLSPAADTMAGQLDTDQPD